MIIWKTKNEKRWNLQMNKNALINEARKAQKCNYRDHFKSVQCIESQCEIQC